MRVALGRRDDRAPLLVVLLADPVGRPPHDDVARAGHPKKQGFEVVRGGREVLADGEERAALADLAQRDVEDEAREERLGLVGPEPVRALALVYDEHLGDERRVVGRVRRARTDEVERVEPTAPDGAALLRLVEQPVRGEPERVERDDVVAEHASTVAGREREVLALRVGHEDGAGVVQQVRDDGPDALAGPRRGDGKRVPWPVVAEKRARPPSFGVPPPCSLGSGPSQDEAPLCLTEPACVAPRRRPVAPRGLEWRRDRQRGHERERDQPAE